MRRAVLLIAWLLATSGLASASHALALLNHSEQNLYDRRDFTALALTLSQSGQTQRADQVLQQMKLLDGCRAFEHGKGRLGSVLKCQQFITNEVNWQLTSKTHDSIANELDSACTTLINEERPEKLLAHSIWHNRKLWPKCRAALKKSLFHKAEALRDSNPTEFVLLMNEARLIP